MQSLQTVKINECQKNWRIVSLKGETRMYLLIII